MKRVVWFWIVPVFLFWVGPFILVEYRASMKIDSNTLARAVDENREKTGGSKFEKFQIQTCKEMKCLLAKSDVAFSSSAGESISARNAVVEIKNLTKSLESRFICNSFIYEITSQFLVCDNRKINNRISFTMDSKLSVEPF